MKGTEPRRPYSAQVVDPARPWRSIRLNADVVGVSVNDRVYTWDRLGEPEVHPVSGVWGTRFAVVVPVVDGSGPLRFMFPRVSVFGYRPVAAVEAAGRLRALRSGLYG